MTSNRQPDVASESVRRAVHIIGIGADGWEGLGDPAREALQEARVVIGSPRQLDLLPAVITATRVTWPTPLRPAVAPLLAEHAAAGLAVLASGDPMHFGIGRLVVDALAGAAGLDLESPDGTDSTPWRWPPRWVVQPHPSSISLACARLGWPVEDVDVVSAVGRDVRALAARLFAGRRVLVLSADADTPAQVAQLLRDRGFGASRMTVLGDLGAPQESCRQGRAQEWIGGEQSDAPRLNVIAIACQPQAPVPRLGMVPGLPDAAYETDGQLTKWEVRAVTLAALAPAPGELLWDVGGGSGSIGIEWMRAHPSCRAITLEARADRAAAIAANAGNLGVPGLRVVSGQAPTALAGLAGDVRSEVPDAVFIGGGLTAPGVVEACWEALRPGGRLVANTVTLESEALLVALRARLGGRLTRLEVSRAEPIGGYLGWRPARPVTQWSVRKPADVRMGA
ncbi:MAG: precorrin-6y C5,15-methyltransferase (decarboxylating) subunit CbiE [Micrococcales bacterium]|nr:precorrin-6y C5,15-methyltransferase (decarboxylating) subunit CbiE [Micrococcales bacterium]